MNPIRTSEQRQKNKQRAIYTERQNFDRFPLNMCVCVCPFGAQLVCFSNELCFLFLSLILFCQFRNLFCFRLMAEHRILGNKCKKQKNKNKIINFTLSCKMRKQLIRQ